MVIDNKSWMLHRVQFCPSEVQSNTTTGDMKCRHTLHGELTTSTVCTLAYTGMVIVGMTEEKVGSLLKVNSTPAPVILALPMCTTTEPVDERNEVL